MRMISKFGIATVVSAAALLAGISHASAQGVTQVIPVAPGVSLVITAQNMVPPAVMPVPPMPDPYVMIRQIEQTLAQAQQNMVQTGLTPVAFPALPQGAGAVVVSSFSDGAGSCTRRVIYPADGGAPLVKVSSTGNACEAAGLETTALPAVSPLPPATVPQHAAPPRLVLAANNVAASMGHGGRLASAGLRGKAES